MKHLGWSIQHSSMSPCESCENTKAKQKNVTKSSQSEKAKVDCYGIYKDGEEAILKNYWHTVVNERNVYKAGWQHMDAVRKMENITIVL